MLWLATYLSFLWQAATKSCGVLDAVPSEIILLPFEREYTVHQFVEFVNDCDFLVTFDIEHYGDRSIFLSFSDGMYGAALPLSTNRAVVRCSGLFIGEAWMNFTASTGEAASVHVRCEQANFGLDGLPVYVSETPGEKIAANWTAESTADLEAITVQYEQSQEVQFINTTYTGLPSQCEELGTDLSSESWAWIKDRKCDVFQHFHLLPEKKHCRGPTTTTTTTTPNEVCCQMIVDIRANEGYEKYDFGDEQWKYVGLGFDYYGLSGPYSTIVVYPQGWVSTRSISSTPDVPEIPKSDVGWLWAGYWQNYSSYGEVGGVANEGEYTIQWTDLEMGGLGKFTQQMTFKATGWWTVSSNLCADQLDLIADSLTGYQDTQYAINIGILPPHLPGWEVYPNIRQQYVDFHPILASVSPGMVEVGVDQDAIVTIETTGTDAQSIPRYLGIVALYSANGTLVGSKEIAFVG